MYSHHYDAFTSDPREGSRYVRDFRSEPPRNFNPSENQLLFDFLNNVVLWFDVFCYFHQ